MNKWDRHIRDENNPETESERRQKFGLWAAIGAVSMFIVGFYAYWRLVATEYAGLGDTAVSWLVVVPLAIGVAMVVIAILSLLSAQHHRT